MLQRINMSVCTRAGHFCCQGSHLLYCENILHSLYPSYSILSNSILKRTSNSTLTLLLDHVVDPESRKKLRHIFNCLCWNAALCNLARIKGCCISLKVLAVVWITNVSEYPYTLSVFSEAYPNTVCTDSWDMDWVISHFFNCLLKSEAAKWLLHWWIILKTWQYIHLSSLN